MCRLLIIIMLVFAVTLSALAQTAAAPDFSGSWVLNVTKSTLAKDSTVKSQTIVIESKKSAIVFHYKIDGKKSTETYTPDGKKRTSDQLTSSAKWRDSVLVIEYMLDIKVPNATVLVTGLKPIVEQADLDCPARGDRLRSAAAGQVERHRARRQHLHQLSGAAGRSNLHRSGPHDRRRFVRQQNAQSVRTHLRHHLARSPNHPKPPLLARRTDWPVIT